MLPKFLFFFFNINWHCRQKLAAAFIVSVLTVSRSPWSPGHRRLLLRKLWFLLFLRQMSLETILRYQRRWLSLSRRYRFIILFCLLLRWFNLSLFLHRPLFFNTVILCRLLGFILPSILRLSRKVKLLIKICCVNYYFLIWIVCIFVYVHLLFYLMLAAVL